jgi:hypothetical protein
LLTSTSRRPSAWPDREGVGEDERVRMRSPPEVVELADGAALVGVRHEVPEDDTLRPGRQAGAVRSHGLHVPRQRH